MKLSSVQADAIQELGNIGAAHAATTLSQMLGSTIEMSVPAIKVVDLAQLGNYMGEESAAMVAFELQGDIPHGGYILFYITRESAVRMTNTMLGMTETSRPLNEMDQSALLEVGNIMVSAFLDATAESLVSSCSPPLLPSLLTWHTQPCSHLLPRCRKKRTRYCSFPLNLSARSIKLTVILL